jgi:hypothetical protein
MRRIPFLLAVMVGVLAVVSGSALAAAVRTVASPPVNNSLPTIAGTAGEGQTLTASSGSWGGATPISYAYGWQRCNSAGSSCDPIGKATSQNYVASDADVGKTIRTQVTATNADGTNEALSAATDAIAASGSAPANTKQPNTSGTAQEGQTLMVDTGSWSGLKPITFSYQWQTCTAATPVCTDLAGVTGASYLVGAGQIGSPLRVAVTATNSAGKGSVFSNLTTAVLAKTGSPVNSRLPMVSGFTSVGQTLHASTGVWTGGAVDGFSFQWTRCNSDGSACANVSGATGSSYGVGQADSGMALRVNVTAKNANGSTTATSAASVIAARSVVTARFNAVLRAGKEVNHPKRVTAAAAGHFTAKITGRTLRWTLTYSHLSGRPTVADLNKGLRNTNGLAFKTLCRHCPSAAHGAVTLTASQVDALMRGRTYVNVRTATNRRGEIRGQINRVS